MPEALDDDPGKILEARRQFLRWLAGSTLLAPAASSCRAASRAGSPLSAGTSGAYNVFDLEAAAREALSEDSFAYLEGGADDMRTVRANQEAFTRVGIRARRLVDVRSVDTSLELLGDRLSSPILLAPVGFQQVFHPEGVLATARAAVARGHRLIASSVTSPSIGEIVAAAGGRPWFQLYPTENREVTKGLLRRAEAAGCRVVVLTVDTPVIGNRERHATTLARLLTASEVRMGNYEGLPPYESIADPGLTWDFVPWLREHTGMRVVLKGIVTAEDTELAVRHGVDGVVVSNHGGRQLEADRATLDSLPEVVESAGDRLVVLLDGGIRRGTDVFEALALGARAVCIGRPYCWGLGAFGQAGVERALELLQAELVRDMQLAGAPSLSRITRDFVTAARQDRTP